MVFNFTKGDKRIVFNVESLTRICYFLTSQCFPSGSRCGYVPIYIFALVIYSRVLRG